MIKNDVYFIVIALLVAELFKILFYAKIRLLVTSHSVHKVVYQHKNFSQLFLYRTET